MRIHIFALSAVLALVSAARAEDLQTRSFPSEVLGMEMKLNVLVPEGYEKEKDRRFPAIYLLHGYGGDYTEWARVGIVAEAAGLPAILVMPEGDKSFYVNHHGDPKGLWEDYLTREMVRFVDQNYRTVPSRESRGISGLSMGGYGAMVLGLRHPELFASVVSHSGALGVPGFTRQGEIGERISKIFGPPDSKERKTYDLVRLVRELPAEERPDIYLDCGSQDFLLDSNRTLVAELAKLKVPYQYREVPGEHNFDYWKRNVRHSLNHQLEALRKAQAAPPRVAALEKPAEKKAEKKEDAAPAPSIGRLLGEWDVLVEVQGNQRDYLFRFSEKEKKLQAVFVSPRSGDYPAKAASFKDGVLRMEVDREAQGQTVTLIFEGKLAEGALKGTMTPVGFSEFGGTFSARKKRKAEEI